MPYVSSEELEVLRASKFEHKPDCVFDSWAKLRTSARENAPIANGPKFPLVLFAPGLGVPRLLYTVYAQQLASDGYIVATFDFQHGGFLVRNGALTSDTLGDDPDGAAVVVADWAKHFSSFIDSAASVAARADLTRIAAIGHSIGGAAALEACRIDKRIAACVDMDGLPFGAVASEGIRTRALWLRSQPDYSDADLAKLHRTRAAWQAMGEKVMAQVRGLLPEPGGAAWVISIHQTAHMSFSDAPYTLPADVTFFGGTFLDRSRFFSVTTQLVEDYFQWSFGSRKVFPSTPLVPEVTVQVARRE